MENSKKIYLANVRASEKFGDDILKGALNVTTLKTLLEEWAYSPEKSDDEFVNIKIVKRKTVSEHNHTHYIELDQFDYNSVNEDKEESEPEITS